jgi:hypothetical protein
MQMSNLKRKPLHVLVWTHPYALIYDPGVPWLTTWLNTGVPWLTTWLNTGVPWLTTWLNTPVWPRPDELTTDPVRSHSHPGASDRKQEPFIVTVEV